MSQVPLGVLLKNENKTGDMLDILKYLHQYVPTVHTTVDHMIDSIQVSETIKKAIYHRILLGGDQLTACRARSCQEAMRNADDPDWKVQGLIPVCEDWHTQVCLLKVKPITSSYCNVS